VVEQYAIALTIHPVTQMLRSLKITKTSKASKAIQKDAVFALELMNVVS
jgi:hypothetical protein